MFWFKNSSEDNKDDRSHQDNFRGSVQRNNGGWDNGSYQYCRFCDGNRRFIYDRCEHCKNN